MAHSVLTLGLRTFQIIFAAVVLALSICAVEWQYYQSTPPAIGLSVFCGAFGCLVGVVGVGAICASALGGHIMFAMDALATIVFLVGGIIFAVGLKHVNCSDPEDFETWFNGLLSGGCVYDYNDGTYTCGYNYDSDLMRRCRIVTADDVFLFLGFIVSLGAAILSFFAMRRARTSASSTA